MDGKPVFVSVGAEYTFSSRLSPAMFRHVRSLNRFSSARSRRAFRMGLGGIQKDNRGRKSGARTHPRPRWDCSRILSNDSKAGTIKHFRYDSFTNELEFVVQAGLDTETCVGVIERTG